MTLREYRGNRTLEQLSKEFNCSISALSKYEHGQEIHVITEYIESHHLPIEINDSDTKYKFLLNMVEILNKSNKDLERTINNYEKLLEERDKIIREYKNIFRKIKKYIEE